MFAKHGAVTGHGHVNGTMTLARLEARMSLGSDRSLDGGGQG